MPPKNGSVVIVPPVYKQAWPNQGCLLCLLGYPIPEKSVRQSGHRVSESQSWRSTLYLITPEMMMYRASSQLGLGRASAQAANMWYGREAFSTNTNSEPLVVTNFSSRITLEAVKSGVNLRQGQWWGSVWNRFTWFFSGPCLCFVFESRLYS